MPLTTEPRFPSFFKYALANIRLEFSTTVRSNCLEIVITHYYHKNKYQVCGVEDFGTCGFSSMEIVSC
jgi:hypothetical protein